MKAKSGFAANGNSDLLSRCRTDLTGQATNWKMSIDVLSDKYHTNGFVIVRGLFEADRLREITGEAERVVHDAASTAEHGRVYFDDEGDPRAERAACAARAA